MIFGRGGGRNFWMLRIGILVLVLAAGAVFHYHGAGLLDRPRAVLRAHPQLRRSRRSGAARRGSAASGTVDPARSPAAPYPRGGMQPPFGGQYPPSQPHPDLPAFGLAGRAAASGPGRGSLDGGASGDRCARGGGAFPRDRARASTRSCRLPVSSPAGTRTRLDPMARHYWDGSTWSHRLKWDGKTWVPA